MYVCVCVCVCVCVLPIPLTPPSSMAASAFRVHVTRAVMMVIGAFWASLVAFNMLMKTIRSRGATLSINTERIMEPKALRDQDLGIHNTLKVRMPMVCDKYSQWLARAC